MTDDLTSWLRAQLDEDEACVRKDFWCLDRATPPPWRAFYGYNLPSSRLVTEGGEEVARFAATDGPQYHESGHRVDGYEDRHQRDVMLASRAVNRVRRVADRTLTEVDAKRRILDLHTIEDNGGGQLDSRFCAECFHDRGYNASASVWPVWCQTVRLLALPYAANLGYRAEWKP